MRLDNQKAYPYPVIRGTHDDFHDENFSAEPQFILEETRVKLTIDYELSCRPIQREIEAGNATYLSVVSCRDTFFHQVYRSNKDKDNDIFIDIDQLKGTVRVESFVYVLEDTSVESININKEFLLNSSSSKSIFHYSKGNIIAQDNEYSFSIDVDLFKPLSSIFRLEVSDDLSDGEWDIFSDADKVVIKVARNIKIIEESLTNEKSGKAILLNSIYFATVMHLIDQIKADEDIIDKYLWARVVDLRITLKKVNIEQETYSLASMLMDYPFSRLREEG